MCTRFALYRGLVWFGTGNLRYVLYPDGKVLGAQVGPTWVLWAPGGPHLGPMNLAIRVGLLNLHCDNVFRSI